jgi:rare lipoprotein A
LIKKGLVIFFTFFYFFSFGQNTGQTGNCSYYADKFHGRKTSSGEVYNKNLFTAAHRSLPYNTVVQVTNLRNQKKVLVKINDRGPSVHNRIIDVSKAAALELGIILYGVEKVKVEVVDVPPQYLIKDTMNTSVTETDKKTVTETNKIEKITKTDNKNSIFDINNQPALPKGYGVQIGFYKILNNCKNQLNVFQVKYKIKGYIFAEPRTKNTYYHLIMGEHTDKKQALDLQSLLEKEIPGCFVVNWDKL